jgi:hypothetical protein
MGNTQPTLQPGLNEALGRNEDAKFADCNMWDEPISLHLTASERRESRRYAEAMLANYTLSLPIGFTCAWAVQRIAKLRSPVLPILSRFVVSAGLGVYVSPKVGDRLFVRPILQQHDLRQVYIKTAEVCVKFTRRAEEFADTASDETLSQFHAERDTFGDYYRQKYQHLGNDEDMNVEDMRSHLSPLIDTPISDDTCAHFTVGPSTDFSSNITLADLPGLIAIWNGILIANDSVVKFTSHEVRDYPLLAEISDLDLKQAMDKGKGLPSDDYRHFPVVVQRFQKVQDRFQQWQEAHPTIIDSSVENRPPVY